MMSSKGELLRAFKCYTKNLLFYMIHTFDDQWELRKILKYGYKKTTRCRRWLIVKGQDLCVNGDVIFK